MSASFTDFKLNLGIKGEEHDTEYASILKALIKEFYTTYGIALFRDKLVNTETINSTYGTEIQLAYKNIVDVTISGFTEDTDYTVDRVNGIITILTSGTMLENTDYIVVYDYYFFISESNEIVYNIYPDSDETTYHIDIKPASLIEVTYNGSVLTEDTDYYYYNYTFEPITTPTNNRLPYKLKLNVGYDEMPLDLKQAFYDLANIRFDMKEAKTYLIDKVSDNAQGTSTKYRMDSLPLHIKNILYEYTGRRFAV